MMAQLQKSAQSQLKQYLGENLDTPTRKESTAQPFPNTDRAGTTRLISARPATRKERKAYESDL
ncbi:hypothetical protein [Nostoc sp.]|uniref:hypothetical protein n=1 Tax=Nostoc sp. TaxID=1180 RepID=UPI002FF89940